MKVLVPVEDILFGSAIADFITQHQWPSGTEIRIIHAIDPYFLNNDSHAPFVKLMEMSGEQITGSATRTVEEIAKLIKGSLPDLKVTQQVIVGHPKEQIMSIAADWQADLIIAGSHGRGGFNRFMLGSVSLMLASEAACPVLLIKPNATRLKLWDNIDTFSSDAVVAKACSSQAAKRVLIALDNTAISDELINFVIKHNWTQPAHFKILHVVRPASWFELHSPEFSEMYQDTLESRKASVRKAALRMRDYYHSGDIEEDVIEGDPKKVIVEAAEQWGTDLILLGCHMRDGLHKLHLGSVSLAVLCSSPCSVLIVRQRSNKIESKALAGRMASST